MVWKGLDPSKASIAIIGAGAAGIASFRALREAGFENIAVFEATSNIGGTWVYATDTDDVHSSMYASLRTNIPRQAMCFADVPFDNKIPSFPGHAEVAKYLQDVAKDCGFSQFIRFNTRIARVDPQDPKLFCTGWTIQTHLQSEGTPPKPRYPGGGEKEGSVGLVGTTSEERFSKPEHFDAVFVCCGHFTGTLYSLFGF
jgi:cation diffusion facilitator CzcD-associated flavoprotein CzcO